MNQVINMLQQHRSIRSFKETLLTEEERTSILNAARSAASSSFLQCTSIIRITDLSLKTRLMELSGNQSFIMQSPEFWVFCADFYRHKQICPEAELGNAETLLLGCIDTAILAQNAVVAAESLGLGTVYIGGLRNQLDEVTKVLQLPKHVLPLFGLCIGHPGNQPDQKPRLPASLMCFENCYQPIDQAELDEYDQIMHAYYAARHGQHKDADWSHQLKRILSKEQRSEMLSYLHSQGWITH